MIIAVNTRLLLKNKLEGIGRFTFEILNRITRDHKDHTFIFFFDREFDKKYIFSDNITPVVLFPPARHPVLWYLYFEWSVFKALKKYKADIFITTDGWLSLKSKVKTLQVLHDLHFDNYPGFLPFLARKYYQYFFPKFIRRANRIVTVSNYCKFEISEKYAKKDGDIDVVYNSTREEYYPLEESGKTLIRNSYTKGHPYFLFIGPLHPRKNLSNIIKAFQLYKRKSNDTAKLVITGDQMWRNFGAKIKIDNAIKNDVVFTGYLATSDLFKITAAAECLLYVSFYEGFGMPVLEAMSCNVPVITSNCSAMPEIAQDAALLVDPANIESIADAMMKIHNDSGLKRELISRGRTNLMRFSWENSAKVFWNSILKLAED